MAGALGTHARIPYDAVSKIHFGWLLKICLAGGSRKRWHDHDHILKDLKLVGVSRVRRVL